MEVLQWLWVGLAVLFLPMEASGILGALGGIRELFRTAGEPPSDQD